MQEVGFGRGDGRPEVRGLFLIIHRDRAARIQVPGKSADNGIAEGRGPGIRFDAVPAGDDPKRRAPVQVGESERMQHHESGKQPSRAVRDGTWRCRRVRPALPAVGTRRVFPGDYEPWVAYSDKYSGPIAIQPRPDRSDLTGTARDKLASDRAAITPAGKGERSKQPAFRSV